MEGQTFLPKRFPTIAVILMLAASLWMLTNIGAARAQPMGKAVVDSTAAVPPSPPTAAAQGDSPTDVKTLEPAPATPTTVPAVIPQPKPVVATEPVISAPPQLESGGLTMPPLPVALSEPTRSAAAVPQPVATTPVATVVTAPAATPVPTPTPTPAPQPAPAASVPTPAAAPVAEKKAETPTPVAKTEKYASEIEQKPIRLTAPDAGVSASQPAAANTDVHAPSGFSSAMQVGAALAIVIGLIFVGKAMARKFLPGAKTSGGKGVIEILARHPLCKNQSLVLVRIGSQIVALNQGKETSQSLLVINEATEVAQIIGQIEGKKSDSIQAGFTKLLANARMDLETTSAEDVELRELSRESLDDQLDEMAAAKRQLMELRQHVRSVRDSMPRS